MHPPLRVPAPHSNSPATPLPPIERTRNRLARVTWEVTMNLNFPRVKMALTLIKSLFHNRRTLWKSKRSSSVAPSPPQSTQLPKTTHSTLWAVTAFSRCPQQWSNLLVSRQIRHTLLRFALWIIHQRPNGCTFCLLRPHSSKSVTQKKAWSPLASPKTSMFNSRPLHKCPAIPYPPTSTTTTRSGSTVRATKFWSQFTPTPSSTQTAWTRSPRWST